MTDEKLRRERAGVYRTPDGRFEVVQESGAWFVTDSETVNELGQPVLLGPYPSMQASRAGIDELRAGAHRVAERPTRRKAASKPAPPPPPPPSWIDELPSRDRSRVRRMITELERLGVPNAEDTVRADVEGLLPAIARRVVLGRIEAIIAEHAGDEAVARAVAGAVLEALSGQRESGGALPGWQLVETNGSHGEAPIRLTADDVRAR